MATTKNTSSDTLDFLDLRESKNMRRVIFGAWGSVLKGIATSRTQTADGSPRSESFAAALTVGAHKRAAKWFADASLRSGVPIGGLWLRFYYYSFATVWSTGWLIALLLKFLTGGKL